MDSIDSQANQGQSRFNAYEVDCQNLLTFLFQSGHPLEFSVVNVGDDLAGHDHVDGLVSCVPAPQNTLSGRSFRPCGRPG